MSTKTYSRGARSIGITGNTDNLRTCLRGATAAAHDLLDGSMRAASGWTSRADYARFLTLQHAAREPVENWLAEHAPCDLAPPAQCALIADDIAKLGGQAPAPADDFALHAAGDTAHHALGAAWVLAGSSLGNRAILKEVERAGNGNWPHAFLGDQAMLTFWKRLRERIERPASITEVEAASSAATAVFDHFIHFAQAAPATSAKERAPA